jgi:hypothetical protein
MCMTNLDCLTSSYSSSQNDNIRSYIFGLALSNQFYITPKFGDALHGFVLCDSSL